MLMNNCFRTAFDGTVEGSALALLPGQTDAYRQHLKFIEPSMASAVLQGAADPPGHYIPETYHPPVVAGEMSMRTDSLGSMTAGLIPTRPMALDMTGSGTLSATAALAIAMALAMTGAGSMALTVEGRLNMSMDLTGSGDMTADMSGFANMAIDLLGQGDLEATIAAYGNMELDIVVTGTGLSIANVGDAVWAAVAAANNTAGTMGEKLNDAGSASNPWTEVIESGYTAAEILRLIAAAMAGKASGLGGSTATFRDIGDTKDRIVATVDSSGNRTALTLDGT